MFNLSLLSIFAALYISLYLIKMIIIWPSHNILAREALHQKTIQVPENWTMDDCIRLMQIFYFIGAGITLIFLLIPTIYQEGLSFFESYSEQQVESFIKNEEQS